MRIPPTDFKPYRTADGSYTLRSESWDVFHHSVVGAVNESTHVFIKAGLEAVHKPNVDVLEVGLGTGLNLLLTWIRCLEGKCAVRYTALEPFPLPVATLEELQYCEDLAWPGLHGPFLDLMTCTHDDWNGAEGGMTFRKLPLNVSEIDHEEMYDVIYFDAFGPNTQPELWTLQVFQRMHRALRHGGLLVTYCAKGDVRRTMQAAGFGVERLQGPPGKREMLRGRK
ncbi:MAG: tRNA (5-methylaminomethyl-2-thiouridine)(34)-methyltransferase MnmD [Flavobacteriales bacterium]|nr:tRNA (5-methylaminomethyl-2-thiouridine)(34)-methyltransferase MnmD [Flavobacteriales bacterium]MBP7155789.1 tRNA (5-methylaminomethyl-2-thiouridine)(34)-methyltransferase MnmD [Flavobacteriales bacterium]HQV76523.1 tRNA (5-methylaminomethyl-2-thiouridine)(34)-methyltransferase MnmD [Flavobacteriales bacterium]